MFDILVYLFENYYTPQSCPEADVLARRLAAAGFEREDIHDALGWLYGLATSTEQCVELAARPAGQSCRIYTDDEYQLLGSEAVGFLSFLENSGALPAPIREIVVERVWALDERPIGLDRLKTIVLMVLWSQEAEVDHLILEELLSAQEDPRPLH
ncbi:MAG: DUF494 domain-containing protein [Corticimicrobacter sp.]|uniref:DUF494 family protein n=1 Tax=Corticimicrobacter sp. TaxID=2678536 RepID=UPI0032DAAE4C